MMSVLIKGFEVPKDGCKDCAMVQRGKVFDTCPFLKQEVNGNVERGGKPNGCPLIEVPNTNVGDTISRQAAIETVRSYMEDHLDIYDSDWHADGIAYEIKRLPSEQPKLEQNTPPEQGECDKLGVKMGETCIDTISRQAAIEAIEQHKKAVLGRCEWVEGIAYGYEAAHRHLVDIVMQLPSAQPEIIRCKDCKHRPKEVEGSRYLEFPDGECICQCVAPWYEWMPEDDFYCAKAERRE